MYSMSTTILKDKITIASRSLIFDSFQLYSPFNCKFYLNGCFGYIHFSIFSYSGYTAYDKLLTISTVVVSFIYSFLKISTHICKNSYIYDIQISVFVNPSELRTAAPIPEFSMYVISNIYSKITKLLL